MTTTLQPFDRTPIPATRERKQRGSFVCVSMESASLHGGSVTGACDMVVYATPTRHAPLATAFRGSTFAWPRVDVLALFGGHQVCLLVAAEPDATIAAGRRTRHAGDNARVAQAEALVGQLEGLCRDGRETQAMEAAYPGIDSLMKADLRAVDHLLSSLDPNALSAAVIVSVLIVTLPAMDRLATRATFVDRSRARLAAEPEGVDDILRGLV